MITFQSKMNYRPPTDIGVRGNEAIAREYLNSILYNQWAYFKNIPKSIQIDVINMLDLGYKEGIRVVFDELCEKFFVTYDANPIGLSLSLKKEHKII